MEQGPSEDIASHRYNSPSPELSRQPSLSEGDIALSGLRKWFTEKRLAHLDSTIDRLRVSDEVHRTIGEHALGGHSEGPTEIQPNPHHELLATDRLATTHRPITRSEIKHSFRASKQHHKALEKAILASSLSASWSIGNASLGTDEHRREAQSIRLHGKERRGMNKAMRVHNRALANMDKTRGLFEEEARGEDRSGRRRRRKLDQLTTKRTRLLSKLRGE